MVVSMNRQITEEIDLIIRRTPPEHKFDYAAILPKTGETMGFFHPHHLENIYTLELYEKEFSPNQTFYHIIDGVLQSNHAT